MESQMESLMESNRSQSEMDTGNKEKEVESKWTYTIKGCECHI